MKPNTPMLAMTTGLISRSPGPIRRYYSPMNIAAQRCGDMLGFTQCVQPNLQGCFAHPSARSNTRWPDKA